MTKNMKAAAAAKKFVSIPGMVNRSKNMTEQAIFLECAFRVGLSGAGINFGDHYDLLRNRILIRTSLEIARNRGTNHKRIQLLEETWIQYEKAEQQFLSKY